MSKLSDYLAQYETESGPTQNKEQRNRNRLAFIGDKVGQAIAEELATDPIYARFLTRIESNFGRGRDDGIVLTVVERKRRFLWWYNEHPIIRFVVSYHAITNFDRIFVECRDMNAIAPETFIIDEEHTYAELKAFVEPRLQARIAKRLLARKREPGPGRISRTSLGASTASAPPPVNGNGAGPRDASALADGAGSDAWSEFSKSWAPPPAAPNEDLLRQIREIMTTPEARTPHSPKSQPVPEQDTVTPKPRGKRGRGTPQSAERNRSSATPRPPRS